MQAARVRPLLRRGRGESRSALSAAAENSASSPLLTFRYLQRLVCGSLWPQAAARTFGFLLEFAFGFLFFFFNWEGKLIGQIS